MQSGHGVHYSIVTQDNFVGAKFNEIILHPHVDKALGNTVCNNRHENLLVVEI